MFRIVAGERRRARHDPAQVALHERDPGALHRDVGARAHRDPDIGQSERRRVVDPVSRHGHDPPLALEPHHRLGLGLRKHVGDDLVDPQAARDRLGRRAGVSGEHDDPKSVAPERAERLVGRRLDRIGDRDQPRQAAAVGHEQHRLPFGAE